MGYGLFACCSAARCRRGENGVERLGCCGSLAFRRQFVEIAETIQHQSYAEKRIQRYQPFALKPFQRTPRDARPRRQFSLRQVHGKTPGLEPARDFLPRLLRSFENNSQLVDL